MDRDPGDIFSGPLTPAHLSERESHAGIGFRLQAIGADLREPAPAPDAFELGEELERRTWPRPPGANKSPGPGVGEVGVVGDFILEPVQDIGRAPGAEFGPAVEPKVLPVQPRARRYRAAESIIIAIVEDRGLQSGDVMDPGIIVEGA